MMTSEPERAHPLEGMRILVADDEFLIATMIEETFRDAGAEIVSAATLAQALQATEASGLSAAVLDVRLGRQTTEAVADVLASRNIPFVFCSGQALPETIRSKHPAARLLTKPVRLAAFVGAILAALEDGATAG